VKLYFGKYKGSDIHNIPADYLRWLLTRDIDPALRQAIEDLLAQYAAMRKGGTQL
jgi:uncharacterized protein (DUF3820 family)